MQDRRDCARREYRQQIEAGISTAGPMPCLEGAVDGRRLGKPSYWNWRRGL